MIDPHPIPCQMSETTSSPRKYRASPMKLMTSTLKNRNTGTISAEVRRQQHADDAGEDDPRDEVRQVGDRLHDPLERADRTSFSSSARMIGAGKPKTIL